MSSRVRWGIIGTGRIAARFAEGLRGVRDAELAAVGSRERHRAETFRTRTGASRAHGSYEELVDDPSVDVVYVGTPNRLHREHCLLALNAGKPVLCEKPFAASAVEAREVVGLSRARGLFCMEAMWMRFAPAAREMMALVRAGAIGTPLCVSASLGYLFDEENPAFGPDLGGGSALDLGVYPLSLAVWLLGRPNSVRSDAVIGRTGVDERIAALLNFDSGAHSLIAVSLRSLMSNDAVIVGTEGLIRLREPICCPEAFVLTRARKIGSGSAHSGVLGRILHQGWLRWARSLAAGLRSTVVICRVRGNGMGYEAEEVMRCLHESRIESAIMPLSETVAVLETVDAMRSAWTSAGRSVAVQGGIR